MSFIKRVLYICVVPALVFTMLQPAIAQQKKDLTVPYKKNPMRFTYSPKHGNYINDLDKPHIDKIDKNPWFAHFLRFPITYWIKPCRAEQRKQILEGLKQYALYFPLQEVKTKSQAFLVIEVVKNSELKKLCGKIYTPTTLGCGGSQYGASMFNGVYERKYKGYLYIKNGMFAIPGSITVVLHELGHAFGIRGHSKNPNDIMYYAVDTWALMSKNKRALKIPKHLTYRDVNTLYMIYNDWYDRK